VCFVSGTTETTGEIFAQAVHGSGSRFRGPELPAAAPIRPHRLVRLTQSASPCWRLTDQMAA
jgi:hypothetical protein